MEDLIAQVIGQDEEVTEVPAFYYATKEQTVRLIRALQSSRYVSKADFSGAQCSPSIYSALSVLFQHNTVLEYVRFPSYTSNEEFLSISTTDNGLCQNASIKTLDLTICILKGYDGGEAIRVLLARNKNITKICLAYNEQFGCEGAVRIAQALRNDDHDCCSALRSLDLGHTSIGSRGTRELSRALRDNHVLEELNLRHNEITFDDCVHVTEMLEVNTSLQLLILWENPITRRRTPSATPAAAGELLSLALKKNTSLRTLDLASCGLTQADATCLFRSLASENQTVQVLNLENNILDEPSLQDLALYLPAMKGLQHLQFNWCHGATTSLLRGVLQGLFANSSLLSIDTNSASPSLQLEPLSVALWHTWSSFVTARNQMAPLLCNNNAAGIHSATANSSSATTEETNKETLPTPPQSPAGLWSLLLDRCNGRNGEAELKASLIFHVLVTRTSEVFGMVLGPRKQQHV